MTIYRRVKCTECAWSEFGDEAVGMTPCYRCTSTGYLYEKYVDGPKLALIIREGDEVPLGVDIVKHFVIPLKEGKGGEGMRYMINDQDVRHATESRILELVEKMVCGDSIVIQKESGTGWMVEVLEADEPLPRAEDEG